MRKTQLTLALMLLLGLSLFSSCKNDNKVKPEADFATLQQNALNDFVDVLAMPLYADFEQKASDLKAAVHQLADSPTLANQLAARQAWKDTRTLWEQGEGFLIGPVEDDNYDPYLDTWPTDFHAMENLLNSSTPLTVQQLEGYDSTNETQLSLRGFHPLEFLLWGTSGNRDTVYTTREKEYMVALVDDIYNNVAALNQDWLVTGGNFGQEIKQAGESGSRYQSRKDALKSIASALSDICGEVGEGKMVDPFLPHPDSTQTESPYSHNSLIDFKNNIQGAYNVYLCQFNGRTGASLSDIVSANNKLLDADIKQKFVTALGTFSGFNTTFEKAIYMQPSQVQTTINSIKALKGALDNELMPYLEKYIKD